MSYYHLAELVHKRAAKYKSRTVLKYRDNDQKKWLNISWNRLSDYVMKTAWAMAEIGIETQENIGIYSQNMYQYIFTDFGAYANRAATVPIYATASPLQVEYIVHDAQIRTLFVGEQFQYNNAYKVQQHSAVLKRLIIFDPKVKKHPEDTTSIYFDDFIASGENSDSMVKVSVRLKSIRETDTACIIYTSGTTGEPKGVVLLHSSFLEVFRIHDERLPKLSSKDLSMNFLPLAHIFEKAWTYYTLHKGMTIAINTDAKEIQKSIKQVRPTLMCSVPRFWEKVYQGVNEKIDSSKGIMRWLYTDSIKTGKIYNLDYKNEGKKAPLGTRLKFTFYNNTIFRILKMVIGIEKGVLFPCAGSPLSDQINIFLQSVNIPIIIGYGLTETTATVTCYPDRNFIIHSVGTVMPGLEVKIDPANNEILVKGRTVMKEYYKKPEETAKVFTEDGFFRTGDAGELLADNTIVLTERIKDLFKTSNGKYIAPQAIETLIANDKFIDMISIIGDDVKFVSALVVPDYDAVEKWAKEHDIVYSTREELLKDKIVISMISTRIEMQQAPLAPYEKVKRFTLLPEPFTMESGELTNTLKIKRKVVAERYKDIINKMYED
ncbi:long-chain fatty acid--CoA ligase [Dysgonomonas capnocytophagoides]|uniref:AMP-dependent synthetase/ligase n=1 Tax=Dysgonomonas capnocytophagoides TaxID=45254 RepID=UPI00291CF2CB|nr:long-chain fatty acid--CoA ligase [Dysgonomonas capnocytophagoides]BES63290.1 AMP-dependent synthetase/ligase [Dysgonomonas capnocytophagoides]